MKKIKQNDTAVVPYDEWVWEIQDRMISFGDAQQPYSCTPPVRFRIFEKKRNDDDAPPGRRSQRNPESSLESLWLKTQSSRDTTSELCFQDLLHYKYFLKP